MLPSQGSKMSKSFSLTDEQLNAINSDRNIVITACPGSGKTTIMVEKIRKEIPSLKNHQGIIGITFTVKASKELKARCSKDSFNLKSSFFGTIDHFCLAEIIYPFANRIFGSNENKIECKKYIDIDDSFKNRLPNLDDNNTNLITSDYDRYHDEFERHYQSGFILLEAVGIIANHILNSSISCKRYIRARYTSLYVDEYQDSSEPQHQLFLILLNLGLRAIAVGDERQSIYAWRGGSSTYIRELIGLNDIFEHHIVNINHRCHPSIINYANRLYSKNCSLLDCDEIRVFRRCFEGTQTNLASQLNKFIPETAESFKVRNLSEIAILVRNNSSLDYLVSQLTLPFRIYKDDLLSLINSRHTELYSDLLKYCFNESYLLHDISQFAMCKDSLTKSELSVVRRMITGLRGKDSSNLSLEIQEISLNLIGSIGNEREIQALDHIISNQKEIQQYQPSSLDELQVMTLHKSKGLEFEVVFHLDLYDWVFPYRKYTGDWGDYLYPSWHQELNLHHVGITRARSACILAYSTRRLNSSIQNKTGQPSAFLSIDGLEGLYL
jgi:DNA helicase-2/ATP-dependent DNA helicase PcrA